jgi:hypothetical protein
LVLAGFHLKVAPCLGPDNLASNVIMAKIIHLVNKDSLQVFFNILKMKKKIVLYFKKVDLAASSL